MSCSQESAKPKAQTIKPIIKCQTEVEYGDILLCNPEIEGMQECISNERIKQRQEFLGTNGIITLGYYISNEKFKNIEKLEKLNVSDVIKVYAPEANSYTLCDTTRLNSTFAAFKNNCISAKWDSIRSILDNKNLTFKLSKPVMLESYCLKHDSKSAIVLMRASNENDERFIVTAMNLLRCKERLIFLAYYLEYTGIESVTKAKAKNDYIVLRFLEAN